MGVHRVWDREKVFKDLIAWSKKPDSINLCGFCAENDLPPSMLIAWSKETKDFTESYELAKANLGSRREKMLNAETLHVKAYDLNAANYDVFLREERRVQAEFEAKLKKEEEAPANTALLQETIEHLKAFKPKAQ